MRTHRLSFLRAPVLLLAASVLLSACGERVNRFFGLVIDAPDEFQVTTRAPLSMPPTDDLPPPRPGASRPQELAARRQAEQVLVPTLSLEGPAQAGPSAGQEALLASSGPAANPAIRDQVNAETLQQNDDRTLVQRMLFWQTPADRSVVVDPEREAQRLRENAALGQNSRAGDTAVQQPKPKSFWDRIF